MVAVAASPVGATSPQIMQVVASGLTIGVPFRVVGSLPSGFSWTVPGGNDQVAAATTVYLGDTAAPLEQTVTYTVTQAGVSASILAPVLPMPADWDVLLTSLSGDAAAGGFHDDNADPRDIGIRQAVFEVAGRSDPVIRWDTSTSETGELVIETTQVQTAALLALLRVGAPIIVRTDGQVRDLDPVQIVTIVKAPRTLVATSTSRRWVLAFRRCGYPEPSTAIAPSTWDDFDAAYTLLTWDQFDAEWASLAWDDFDAADWANH